MAEYVKTHILVKKEVLCMSDIKHHYKSIVNDIAGGQWSDLILYSHKLKEKLLKHFNGDQENDVITICKGTSMNDQIIYSSELTAIEIISKEICT